MNTRKNLTTEREEAKIKAINDRLSEMGSKFRTSDGKTLIRYNGNLVFLKRSFDTVSDCYNFVMGI